MTRYPTLSLIRTPAHIRGRQSIPTCTGSGRMIWPRVRESEMLSQRVQRLNARRAQWAARRT